MKNKKKSEEIEATPREKKSFAMLYKLTNVFDQLELIFNFILFLFYITGNYQEFQSETQLFVLQILAVNSGTMILMSLFCMVQIIVFSILERKFSNKIWQTFFSILSFIVGVIFLIVSIVIIKISKGLI